MKKKKKKKKEKILYGFSNNFIHMSRKDFNGIRTKQYIAFPKNKKEIPDFYLKFPSFRTFYIVDENNIVFASGKFISNIEALRSNYIRCHQFDVISPKRLPDNIFPIDKLYANLSSLPKNFMDQNLLYSSSTNDVSKETNKIFALNNSKIIKIISTNKKCIMDVHYENTIISKLQLIRGANNHVTKGHLITDKIVGLLYYTKDSIQLIEIVIHYCEKCDKYFDFENSFNEQMKQHNLIGSQLMVNCYDDNNFLIGENLKLREFSKLKMYGYSVSEHGLSDNKRKELLMYLIRNKILSTSEIKQHLEFLITYNGKKRHNKNAVVKWRDDISFINNYIKHVNL